MSVSVDEVLNVWGRKLMQDRGIIVSENDSVSFEIASEHVDDGCDDCAFDLEVVVVKAGSEKISFDSYELQDILRKLVETAQMG